MRKGAASDMERGAIRATSRLLALVLFVVVVTACGCGGRNQATRRDRGSSAAPRETAAEPESTAPVSQGGRSPSEVLLEQAKAEGKPVLLKFGSGRCLPCIEMDRNINSIRPDYEGNAAIIIVDLNDRREYDFAMKYNVETIPTTIFFNRDGTVADSYVGVMTPDELRNRLNSLL